MCIKQIKIRLYKWIYKFLQIGCQVKNTILSVTYTSDKLMQYQLTENSTKMHKDSIETFSIIFNRKLSFYSLTFQIKKKIDIHGTKIVKMQLSQHTVIKLNSSKFKKNLYKLNSISNCTCNTIWICTHNTIFYYSIRERKKKEGENQKKLSRKNKKD